MTNRHSPALEQSIARKYKSLRADLDERSRRLWAATEAREIGWGGMTIVHRATALNPKTILRGCCDLKELEKSPRPSGEIRRIRQKGGGRKTIQSQDSTFLSDLDSLIDPTMRGDPISGIRWTCKSTRRLAKELLKKRTHHQSHDCCQ